MLYNYRGAFSWYLYGPDNRLQYDIAGTLGNGAWGYIVGEAFGISQRAANTLARSSGRELTATTLWFVSALSACTKRSAIQPGPATAQRKTGIRRGSGTRGLGRTDGKGI